MHVYNSLPTVWSWKTATDKIDSISTTRKIGILTVSGIFSAATALFCNSLAGGKITFLATVALPASVAIITFAVVTIWLGRSAMKGEMPRQLDAYIRALGLDKKFQFTPTKANDAEAIALLKRGNLLPKGPLTGALPFHISLACGHGRIAVMEYLLTTYPECIEMTAPGRGSDESLLFKACRNSHLDMVLMLLKAGSRRNTDFANLDLNFAVSLYASPLPNHVERRFAGPLYKAAANFIEGRGKPVDKEIFMELVRHGADIFKLGSQLYNPTSSQPSSPPPVGNLMRLLQKKPKFLVELLEMPKFRAQVIKRYPRLGNGSPDNASFKQEAMRCLARDFPIA